MKKSYLILLFPLFIACNASEKSEQVQTNKNKANPTNKGPHPSFDQLINEMDADKDGKLSKTEVYGPLANDFATIDTDGDGFLSSKELEKAPKPPGKEQTAVNFTEDMIDAHVKALAVNTDYFIEENIIGEITQEKFTLSGIETLCYVIKTHSQATEHSMGPWCPRHIDDGAEEAGIWFKDGKVYDVSGHFISTLDEFYSDEKWKLYNSDGSIRVTETEEGCLAAAKPDVEEAYQNYCVECLPEYFKDQITTYVIPVYPRYVKSSQSFGRGGIGVAFNGVKYDPPAPTHAILAAHTLAPLDHHGGHVNPHGGYHYHAVTGSTKEIAQTEKHAPMLGYAMDGFGIYALKDQNGNIPTDLDECGGHSDEIRGYHYHVGAPGDNQIIKCLHGVPGYTEVIE